MSKASGLVALLIVLLLGFSAPRLSAQDQGGPDLEKFRQLIRQIHRNMKKVEQKLAIVESEGATSAGKQAEQGLDELIDQLKGGSQQIVKDMDEVIANWPQ